MIRQITLFSDEHKELPDCKNQGNKWVIDCSEISQKTNSFDVVIEFDCKIKAFRNHDYQWVDVQQNRIAAEFSPKILQLENGYFVQANINLGFWEIDQKNSKQLLWRFNPKFSKPIVQYVGTTNAKKCVDANAIMHFTEQPTLLFSKNSALEISRSPLGFSAIVCFTDHCDFDTLENLKVQRNFFKEKHIKITKGFFLNHFSKRADNASYENDKTEIENWKDDGHELCYHSLSQSIKSDEESKLDFINFTPPFSDIPVWIDHGYQPYNFSLFKNCNFETEKYESALKKRHIKILWNYIDSGTATNGVINQLNPNHFTLNSFLKGNENLSKIKLFQAVIKNIVFHYLNDEKIISNYKATAQHFKKIVYQKQIKIIPKFLMDFAVLFKSIASVLFFWNSTKNRTFKFSKYTPLLFKHTILNDEFVIFQTLEMIDFSKSLTKENIDLLLKENGIFIAHTYFSDSVNYHEGKMLTSNNIIDEKVAENFSYLSKAIEENKIWNPTLSELYNHIKQFDSVVFDLDPNGTIIVKNAGTLLIRSIQ